MFENVLSSLGLETSYNIGLVISVTIVLFLFLNFFAGFYLIYGSKSKLHNLVASYFSQGYRLIIPTVVLLVISTAFVFESPAYKVHIFKGREAIFEISRNIEIVGSAEFSHCNLYTSQSNCESLQKYALILEARSLLTITEKMTFSDLIDANMLLNKQILHGA
ncbi:hypothetical protein [Moritella sp. F3]|uniref:hypothetical protein n=1 Tax=Moritella sp. F3 TaxID=2718882 RepID=UPI0018E14A09|nr:hypothetical protein [Moritella sp. F3]GIC77197.1 hypothetical protein FMO001_19240 [Moritella sp. F1]GIC82316.1 hypothetical protein FMO003_25970 [Moritella sp. F3]